jgi:hypothetical protein
VACSIDQAPEDKLGTKAKRRKGNKQDQYCSRTAPVDLCHDCGACPGELAGTAGMACPIPRKCARTACDQSIKSLAEAPIGVSAASGAFFVVSHALTCGSSSSFSSSSTFAGGRGGVTAVCARETATLVQRTAKLNASRKPAQVVIARIVEMHILMPPTDVDLLYVDCAEMSQEFRQHLLSEPISEWSLKRTYSP